MKKYFLFLLFPLLTTSGQLPSVKGVIYHSTSNETITVTLSNTSKCVSVISCGTYTNIRTYYNNQMIDIPISVAGAWFYIDSVGLSSGTTSNPNQRVITFNTHGQDVYGWSDGEVQYEISQ